MKAATNPDGRASKQQPFDWGWQEWRPRSREEQQPGYQVDFYGAASCGID
jgi:hypothetical protein